MAEDHPHDASGGRPPGQGDAPAGRVRLRARRPRFARGIANVLFLFAGFGCLLFGLLLLRITWSPISIDSWAERIGAEINGRLDNGYRVSFTTASIANGAHGPTLAIGGFLLKDPTGLTVVAAPRAEISVALPALLTGAIRPTRLDLIDVDLRLAIQPDGGVAFSVGAGSGPAMGVAPSAVDPVPAAAPVHLGSVAALLREAVDFATSAQSLIGSLQRFGVVRGRLLIEQAANGKVTVFDGMELAFAREAGAARFTLAADGPKGRFHAMARATLDGGARGLEVELRDLSFDEIALAAGLVDPGLSFDMPVSTRVKFDFAADGALAGASFGFAVGAGEARFGPQLKEKLFFDEISGRARWNPAARRIDIEPVHIVSGETQIAFTGVVEPPDSGNQTWRVALKGEPGNVFGPENPGEEPVVVDRASLAATIDAGARRIAIDRLEVVGPHVNFTGNALFDLAPDATHVKFGLAVGRMPSFAVLRLWPKFAAPPTREYLVGHLRGAMLERGSLKFDLDAEALASLTSEAPLRDDAMAIDFTVSQGNLMFLPGVPPLSGIEATGKVTGRTASVNASRGLIEGAGGRKVSMTDGVFTIADTSRKPPQATLVAHVAGSLDAVGDILAREGLKSYGGMQIDSSMMKGQLDGKLTIDMKLAKNSRPGDTSVRVAAAISNFTVERIIGKEKLDQGVLNVAIDGAGMKASGTGRLFGSPATIELKKSGAGAPDAIIQFTVDEAARARMGINLGSGLSGPVAAKITAPFGKDDAPAHVELDMTRVAIDGLLPGLVKLAGRPAKASFVLRAAGGGITVEQLNFEATGGAAARGTLELDGSGGFRSARLSLLRISPGDDIKVDADQSKDRLKLVVRGNSVDARPFLRGLMGADSGSGPKDAGAGKDIDLDLRAALVTGYNRQAFSAMDLKLTRHNGAIRTFQLQARSGRASISGGTQSSRDSGNVISLTTADTGGFLAFLDIYRRMEGGRMQLTARMSEGGLEGQIRVDEFILRDEPALRRLVTEGVPAERQAGPNVRIDTRAPEFQRLSAIFSRGGGRFTVRDGVLLGQQIGLKLDGTLDTARDQINMAGVFVPAYGLNNLFSKIPLFGPILGGDRNEGLFAVNFRITGPASAPALTINPLSAIAPGFLRKIFGVFDGTTSPPGSFPDEPPAAAPAPRGAPARN